MSKTIVLLASLVVAYGLPAKDPVIARWGSPRFDYMQDDQGTIRLVDQWVKLSDLETMARYNPDGSNVYHLFTRNNPTVSQPLVFHDTHRIVTSNYNSAKRTIVLMHGFMGSATSAFNTVLVPAFLEAEDCNVLVLDWSAGSWWGLNAIQAAEAGGRFLTWLNSVTGSTPESYHIIGYSVGGHGAGIMARNVDGNVGYVTALDPAERWTADQAFRPTDGVYTEVIHTSTMGEKQPLGQVDFYPNGGSNMPGCLTQVCDHYRAYFYLAESIATGGFTGRRCQNLDQALTGACTDDVTLNMGGLQAKTGSTGIYYLRTNRMQPFSQG